MTALEAVEALLQFGVRHKLMKNSDVTQLRNQLFDLLRIPPEEIDETLFNWPNPVEDIPETAAAILTILSDDYVSKGHMPEDTVNARDLLEAAIMGRLMPRQSEIINRFNTMYMTSPEAATEDFYALCRTSNYIQVDRIKKDMYWTGESEYGTLELTINLSKPEKDPRDIEAAKLQPSATYPKCLLCLENVGFAGTRAWPSRQNLRAIPVTLDNGQWYFQYSPYLYYNEHCIIFSGHHYPMEITAATFRQLLDFVRCFPHYFLGSNADLPIVGGSILSHEHFQGGRHVFPMEKAEVYQYYRRKSCPNINIGLVKWPLSVIRLAMPLTGNTNELIDLAASILANWRGYSEGNILSHSEDVPHNTITPIARVRAGNFELDLVLRNNRCSDEHPLGIFHPHAQWHHVKKENIGLIEVMGLAVLPGRLKGQIEEGRLSKDGISRIFAEVLKDCGVFKEDEKSRFDTFMISMGMQRQP